MHVNEALVCVCARASGRSVGVRVCVCMLDEALVCVCARAYRWMKRWYPCARARGRSDGMCVLCMWA